MKHPFVTLILLLVSLPAHAEPQGFVWRDSDGRAVPDKPSMKSKDGFGGQFILTANQNIYAEWANPTTPKIDRIDKLPIGELLVPVVIYVNPEKNMNGNIDVTYDLSIFKPDGSLARKVPDIVCGKGSFQAPQFNLQLAQSEVKWGADALDPLGVWTFKLVLKDNVRGTQLPLEASVEIVNNEEPNKAEVSKSARIENEGIEEFGKQMMTFYQAVSRQAFQQYQRDADKYEKALSENDNGGDILLAVAIARIADKNKWPIEAKGHAGQRAKEILEGTSDFAFFIKDDEQVTPSKMDIWWVSFFSTGDTAYLEKILQYAGEPKRDNDMQKMLVIGAATWSFKSNCSQNEDVRSFAKQQLLSTTNPDKKAYLTECLKSDNE